MVRTLHALLILLAVHGQGAWAQEPVTIRFDAGRVWLTAHGVSRRAVLDAWAREGGVRVRGADVLRDAVVTVDLEGVTERSALDILLRDQGGYVLTARAIPMTGAAVIDRIYLLPGHAGPDPGAHRTPSTAAATGTHTPGSEPTALSGLLGELVALGVTTTPASAGDATQPPRDLPAEAGDSSPPAQAVVLPPDLQQLADTIDALR